MPREDYNEMMELCLLILGEPVCSNDESCHFQIPGAYHLARWMEKVICCFKIIAKYIISGISSTSHLPSISSVLFIVHCSWVKLYGMGQR